MKEANDKKREKSVEFFKMIEKAEEYLCYWEKRFMHNPDEPRQKEQNKDSSRKQNTDDDTDCNNEKKETISLPNIQNRRSVNVKSITDIDGNEIGVEVQTLK